MKNYYTCVRKKRDLIMNWTVCGVLSVRMFAPGLQTCSLTGLVSVYALCKIGSVICDHITDQSISSSISV